MFNRHFDPFNLLIDPPTKTIFVLNPKVMTTFVRTMFRDGWTEFRGDADLSAGRYRLFPQARNFPLQPLSSYARLCFGQSDYAVYTMVRNPYARTFSAWKNKFYDPHVQGGGALAAYPRSMKSGELTTFRRFARKHDLEGAADESLVPFPTFLACIAAQSEGRRNHHWDTQCSVIQEQHFDFEKIFRMEDESEACLVTVFTRLGFDPAWVKARLGRPENSSSNPTDLGYTADQAALTRRILARDFETFGYQDDVPKKLRIA